MEHDMNFPSGLDSMKAVVGGLFALFALSTSAPAMERNVNPPGERIVRDSDRSGFRGFLSDIEVGNINGVWLYHPHSVERPATISLNAGFDAGDRPTPETFTDAYFRTVRLDGEDCTDGGNDCSNLFCDNPCPCVYGMVEGLFLMRHPQFSNQPLIVNQTTGATLLSTSGLNFDYNPGLRARMGMTLCEGRSLEFGYFGLFDESASAIALKPDPTAILTFQDNLVGNVFVDPDRVDVEYSSWINSFEVNLPCCCGCCDEIGCGETGCGEGSCGVTSCQSVTWFSGFRYLNLGEQFSMSAQRIVAGATETGSYNIRTANHLYGAQLGARLRRTHGQFGWEAGGAAGIYVNDAQQSQTVIDFPDFPLRTASKSSSTAAFVGDLNLTGLYRLTNVWNLRAGYNVIWIQGVALAPDQIDTDFGAAQGGNHLDNDGGMLLHGFNVGIEARW